MPLVLATIVGSPIRNALIARVPPEYVIAGVAIFSQAMLASDRPHRWRDVASDPGDARGGHADPRALRGRGMWALLGVALACMCEPALVVDPVAGCRVPGVLVARRAGSSAWRRCGDAHGL